MGDQQLSLLEVRNRMRNQVDEALRLLDEGAHGLCEDCGRPIAPERLKVVPLARQSCNARGTSRSSNKSKRNGSGGNMKPLYLWTPRHDVPSRVHKTLPLAAPLRSPRTRPYVSWQTSSWRLYPEAAGTREEQPGRSTQRQAELCRCPPDW